MLRPAPTAKFHRWPAPIPFPPYSPLRPVPGTPVPNASSINWPQAQFAPRYLVPGSPSFSPYVYRDGPTPPFPYRYEIPSALNGRIIEEPKALDFVPSVQSFGADPVEEKKDSGGSVLPWLIVGGIFAGMIYLAIRQGPSHYVPHHHEERSGISFRTGGRRGLSISLG